MNHVVTGRAIETPYTFEEQAARRSGEPFSHLVENTLESIEEYGRENPWSLGLWMMGIGFVLGWKLKMW